jgi:DNA-binding transcriptional MerR regulator/effector-binding domain-containing protein
MFRIGEFARLAGVSAKMLRAWDELGLFRPVWVDPATGYRFYSPAQLPELRRILALRDVGVSLREITDLVAGGADLRAVLGRRRAELEHERREAERRLEALEITVAMAEEGDGLGPGAAARDVVIRPVPAEPAAVLEVDPAADDLGPAFYELEAWVRDHGKRAPRPPGAIAGEAGRPASIFVPVAGPVPASGAITYRRLPACRAASIIHRGSYDGLGDARDALDRWVRAAGLSVAGPLRVLYLLFGAEPELRVPRAYLVGRDADFVTELQQPVG